MSRLKIKFTISRKLLVFILPLVCLPTAAVGYFAIQESVERVNRLVRHEQMVAVKASANTVNDVFYYCRMDLETISRLPVLEDYHIARSFRLGSEAEFHHDNIVKLFIDFISRTPYYYQIRYLDNKGRELIKVGKKGALIKLENHGDRKFFREARQMKGKGIYISDILRSPLRKGYVVHCAKSFQSGWREFAGVVVIDLDYEQIIRIVKNIHVGDRGYAFLIDQRGRNIAHPQFPPYQYNLENYPDQSLKDLVLDMMAGDSGWKDYSFQGEDKVAAFAFIPIIGWSLAVTIPQVEFRKEAQAIQTRVLQVVVITLIITVAGVSLLSYYLMRPVRNLVTATDHISKGDLNHEIPIQTRDELGDLTRSFNRMVEDLSHIQDELIRSEKLISLGRLSSGVAHEIRNPLNAMKGAVVYLQRKRSEDPLIREYTGLVSEEIDRLSQVVTEFLYFAKQATPELLPTDINNLILSTMSLFEKEAEGKKIVLHKLLSPDLPHLPIDAKQVEQVLINLFINAMDAMPEGGELIVLTKALKKRGPDSRPHAIQITVEDTGMGIEREHLQNIFDPFFSTKETGTGLGLPISLGIIEAHGGSLDVTSHPGAGTRAIIELPLTPEDEDMDDSEKEENIGSG